MIPTDTQGAIGSSSVEGKFSIPPQSGSDSLANVTQITKDTTHSFSPTLSKRLDLAYVVLLADGGAEIRVAGSEIRSGVPAFDTGREEFTKSVRGSYDDRPQWDVDGEGMFFDSNRSNNTSNIWYKRRDARGYTQLTFHENNAWFPTVSKDGNKIAYQVSDPQVRNEWSIWLVDRDGRSPTELGPGSDPQFSPDGNSIAFSQRDASGMNQVWVMDTSGGNRIQITNDKFNNETPTWHPNGKKLVFVSDRAGNPDIWMVEVEGTRMDQLTNYMGVDRTPEITPDGKYLLFATTRGGQIQHIWMGELH
jgi:TolB protein